MGDGNFRIQVLLRSPRIGGRIGSNQRCIKMKSKIILSIICAMFIGSANALPDCPRPTTTATLQDRIAIHLFDGFKQFNEFNHTIFETQADRNATGNAMFRDFMTQTIALQKELGDSLARGIYNKDFLWNQSKYIDYPQGVSGPLFKITLRQADFEDLENVPVNPERGEISALIETSFPECGLRNRGIEFELEMEGCNPEDKECEFDVELDDLED